MDFPLKLASRQNSGYSRRITRGVRGGGRGLPGPFPKFKEKCPDFGKKIP